MIMRCKTLISILVPTLCEREDEIKRLLKSLSDQTVNQFEIVFVTQSNHAILKSIIDSYRHLDIVHVELDRKGLSYARNQGLIQCKGEIILLSDDDCWYKNDAVEKLDMSLKLIRIYSLYLQE